MEHHNLQGTGYMVNQNWYNKVAPIQTKEKKPASPDVPSRFSLVLAVEYETAKRRHVYHLASAVGWEDLVN